VAPKATGQIRTYRRSDGLTTYSLRLRALGQRWNIRLGTEEDGWTEGRAGRELAKQLALVDAGVWEPPRKGDSGSEEELSFHAVATRWLEDKELELKPNSVADLRWRLECHLLPFFSEMLPSQIDDATVDDYKRDKQREQRRIEAAIKAGSGPRDGRNQPIKPLSNESINKTLRTLGTILDDANRRSRRSTANPVRRPGTMLKASKPKRDYLEPDELVELIEVAGSLDGPAPMSVARGEAARRMRDVEGRTWAEIAADLGVATSTAIYLHRRPAPRQVARPRRAILATLGCSGLRARELCNLDGPDLDLARGIIYVRDAKTPAGVRQVYISPWLRDELSAYRAVVQGEINPGGPAFPTRTGARRTRHNLLQRVVQPTVRRANEIRAEQGRAALPAITNHTFRRTYISLLFAAGADPPYVMSQVGHEDAKTTLNIYAKVLRRRDRTSVSTAFDQLVADAIPSAAREKIPDLTARFESESERGPTPQTRRAAR
jgi:integrase